MYGVCVCVCVCSRLFSSSMVLLTLYDDDYVTAMPELYTNDPRQFHVRVPCRKIFARNHKCSSPATVVFRVRGS